MIPCQHRQVLGMPLIIIQPGFLKNWQNYIASEKVIEDVKIEK
jgi:hypothetical protein